MTDFGGSRSIQDTRVYAQPTEPIDTRDGIMWIDTSQPDRPISVYSTDSEAWEPLTDPKTTRSIAREQDMRAGQYPGTPVSVSLWDSAVTVPDDEIWSVKAVGKDSYLNYQNSAIAQWGSNYFRGQIPLVLPGGTTVEASSGRVHINGYDVSADTDDTPFIYGPNDGWPVTVPAGEQWSAWVSAYDETVSLNGQRLAYFDGSDNSGPTGPVEVVLTGGDEVELNGIQYGALYGWVVNDGSE